MNTAAQKKPAPIEMIDPTRLRHIEGFSKKRAVWLQRKIEAEGIWTKPLAIDRKHLLVMDGQHRMEVALALKLRRVPCKMFEYDDVEVWSLRPTTHEVTVSSIIERSLSGDIYPYKTAKHRFPEELDELSIALDELR